MDIRTWFDGTWHEGNPAVIRAADHGAWLGSLVFDGARQAHGLTPDLAAHCARLNDSAAALGFDAPMAVDAMVDLVREGLAAYPRDAAIYIRPMAWPTERGPGVIDAAPDSAVLAICLEPIPMAPEGATTTLTRTSFRRPTLDVAVVNAKAGCLYPNNARMIREARSKGFGNALVADPLGNVAESATSNVFIVRDGVVQTPIANGCFLAGITRARLIRLLREAGVTVEETVIRFEDVEAADEVFLSGNLAKVTPVTAFDGVTYQAGPVARRARALYWDWAAATV